MNQSANNQQSDNQQSDKHPANPVPSKASGPASTPIKNAEDAISK